MAIEDFFNLFLLISAIHGFLFCFLFLFSKNRKKTSIIFITLLVLSISLNNFQSWILVKKDIFDFASLTIFEIPWHFLNAPLFFMFLIHYLEINKKEFNLLKIILPIFFLFIMIRIGLFYFYKDDDFVLKRHTVIEEVISIISSIIIFGYSFYVFSKEKKLTEISRYNNLKWITHFFYVSALAYLFWLLPLIITLFLNFNVFIYSYYPLRIFTTILIYWIGYQSIIQLRILSERKYLQEQINIELQKKQTKKIINRTLYKAENNSEINIPEEVVQSILSGLELFEKKQEYTSQNITLNSLAKKLKTNTNYLSKVINHYKETSFSNYLNTLRINNIVALLNANATIRKFTIKAIAQEAGFNTADSFSKVFFKVKGVKPSEYIKRVNPKS